MTTAAGRLNRNITLRPDGSLACTQCDQPLEGGPTDYLTYVPRYETTVDAAGPQVYPDSRDFVDADVVFRQFICPQCATAFLTEVVPVGDAHVPT
jgi:N-methylhydantoinase B